MKLMGYKSKVVVVSVFLCVCMLNMECTNEIWWCMMYDDDDNDKFLLLFCFMIWIWIFFHLLLFLFSIIVNNLGVIHFFCLFVFVSVSVLQFFLIDQSWIFIFRTTSTTTTRPIYYVGQCLFVLNEIFEFLNLWNKNYFGNGIKILNFSIHTCSI